jgi:hypothetical protein
LRAGYDDGCRGLVQRQNRQFAILAWGHAKFERSARENCGRGIADQAIAASGKRRNRLAIRIYGDRLGATIGANHHFRQARSHRRTSVQRATVEADANAKENCSDMGPHGFHGPFFAEA